MSNDAAMRRASAGPRDHRAMAEAAKAGHACVTCMSDVDAEVVRWLWALRIPYGKLTQFVGNPGLGKSFVVLDIASRTSVGGTLPDGAPGGDPADVVILTAEDDLADTVRPRLDRHGADVGRIHVVTDVQAPRDEDGNESGIRWVELDRDLRHIETVITRHNARLLVIDPMSAYMGSANSHNNAEVRSVLGPIADLAARLRVAVIAVTHFNKSTTASIQHRSIGSVAFVAAARQVWGFGEHPDDETKRVMLPIKCNLIEMPTGLSYRIADGRVEWDANPVQLPASVLTRERGEEDGSPVDEACEFLKEVLADGEVEAKSIYSQARSAGIAERTLHRGKKTLGVKAHKLGYGNGTRWVWALTDSPKVANIPEGCHTSEVTTFDPSGNLRQGDTSFNFGQNASDGNGKDRSDKDHIGSFHRW